MSKQPINPKKTRPPSQSSAFESVAGSEYRYIPNNFKRDGVAFTATKLNFDAGISGIYNMGNTCFMSTGKNIDIPLIFKL